MSKQSGFSLGVITGTVVGSLAVLWQESHQNKAKSQSHSLINKLQAKYPEETQLIGQVSKILLTQAVEAGAEVVSKKTKSRSQKKRTKTSKTKTKRRFKRKNTPLK